MENNDACLFSCVTQKILDLTSTGFCLQNNAWQRSISPETQYIESTLYPDVLKIKTIIVVKQNIAKMLFIYYLQNYKSISGYSAAWTSWHQGGQIMDL